MSVVGPVALNAFSDVTSEKNGLPFVNSIQLAWVLLIYVLYPEMETHMLENTLQTRCMDLESIILPMGIGTREPGTRVRGKGLECIHLEMERLNQGTGKTGFLTSQALKAQPILYLLLLLIIPKYSMLSRYLWVSCLNLQNGALQVILHDISALPYQDIHL